MFAFKATNPKTISFAKEQLFVLHDAKTMSNNWWLVVRVDDGGVGFIPHNYVKRVDVSEFLSLIDFSAALRSHHLVVGL